MNDDQTLYEEYEKRCKMKFTAILREKKEIRAEVADTLGTRSIIPTVEASFEGFDSTFELTTTEHGINKSHLKTGKHYIITIEEIK